MRPVVEADHGRIETWTATVSKAIAWRQDDDHQCPGLKAIGKVTRTREIDRKTTTETACYLLSTTMTPEHLGQIVRDHWGVENSLRWVLDVTMNEDQAKNRLDNGPANLAVLRHMALNILNAKKSKISTRRKSNEPDEVMPSSPTSSHNADMRLPCRDDTHRSGENPPKAKNQT